MKKRKVLMLLAAAQYKAQPGDAMCKGDATLRNNCGTCPRCLWEVKRQAALTDHL